MVHSLTDTIVAPITAPGKAAVAILRISGPSAWEIASRLFQPWPNPVQPRFATYGVFENGDDGLVLPFAAEKSFTGEETVELNIHGSQASVASLLEACIREGARFAEPGEFTYRAFMNGRLDLTQAEGIRESIEALTKSQLMQANRLRTGEFQARITEITDSCYGVLAMIEASVDFSEEIGELDHHEALTRLRTVLRLLEELIESEGRSQLVREGLTVAIVGRPNVGKSSLLNALLDSDRAIVTAIAGTTRDTVEEWLDVDGMMVRLIDTAGLRESEDTVEKIGIERSLRAAQSAELIWFVYDLVAGWTIDDERILAHIGGPIVRIGNKADLAPLRGPDIAISAKEGTGLTALIENLRALIRSSDVTSGVNARHAPLLLSARESVERAMETLASETPDDLAAVQLRDAVFSLGQITGESASEDMIQRIFRDFCIGK